MKYIPQAWRIGYFLKILLGNDGAMRRHLLFGIPILISALALIGAADYQHLESPDMDGNGLPDAWELFYGLAPAGPSAAHQDPDNDNSSNIQESLDAKLTDPLAPDTDRDMFPDNFDETISRYFISWGSPRFTSESSYDYAHPDYILSPSYKTDGEWVVMPDETATNTPVAYKTAWYVSATNPPGVGSLSIDLDRTILTNNLRYAVRYMDAGNTGASLFVDLLDCHGEMIVENLYGNLMGATNGEAVVVLDVPTAEFTNAAVIHLRRGTGEVMVREGLVYIDCDGDGLDADQERQLGTSDYSIDTDGDGISDYDEVFIYHTDPCKAEKADKDKGKDKNRGKNKDKKSGVIYVDQAVGNDRHTGRAASVSGSDGPKKTVHTGMAAVDADGAHTMIIKSGAYNENLSIRDKNIKVVIEGKVRL